MLVNVMCCCTKYHQQASQARQCKQSLNITGDWVDQKLFPNLKGVESLKKSEVKLMLNNLLNWSVSWNGWMNCILNLYFQFLIIFFVFLGTFLIKPVPMIPWLLNWIIFWIESAEFFWNWIIFWIESWEKQYWIEYLMNHFLAKFKHWIESDWVSDTTTTSRW